tara:strand:- start:371 stop:607 length:237 start_codon:yes stop_codon:yes gene_type:complete
MRHNNIMNKTNMGASAHTTTTATNYTIEFFDGISDTWKGCGAGTFSNLNQAQDALRGHREMCSGMVDFRIVLDINVSD